MAGLSKGAVIQLILQYIGGNPLQQVPTTTVGGQPVAIKAGLGGLGSLASKGIALAGQAASIASQASALAGMSGNLALASKFSEVTGQLTTISALGSTAQAVTQLSTSIGDLNTLTQQLGAVASLADQVDGMTQYKQLSNGLSSLDSQLAQINEENNKRSALTSLADQVATAGGGLQEGLSYVNKNPLESKITNSRDNLTTYTSNSFNKLSLSLPAISSNVQLANAYSRLKLAIGGPDGKTGAVSQLDAYKLHTDRLSGVTVSSDSDSYEPEESGEEIAFFYNVPGNTNTTIVSFSVNKVRSAKYFVQGSVGLDHQTSEVYIIHDSNTAFTRELGLIYTRNPFIRFTSKIESNTLSLIANSSISNVDIVVYGVKLQIATKASSLNAISQEKILESARGLSGFYPEDTTDYVKMQAGSLYDSSSISTLDDTIDKMLLNLTNTSFEQLSLEQKETYINDYANTINSITASMQQTIDSDVTAQKEVSKKLESASLLYSVSNNYADPNAKALLDLTLTDSVKNTLK